MIVARTRAELARSLAEVRRGGRRLGLVPTMGYLHEGHLSLVDIARERADVAAASIFVNPTQFGPGEDFTSYPRDLERDLALLEARGAALVFVPEADEMYPSREPVVTVDPGPDGSRLCGAFRPEHFRGVLTVVAKLFGLFRPELAVFGRKDFQQLVLVRRMATALDLGVDVIAGPIVREGDGLAMSSRNSYLTPEERRAAPLLHQGLARARARFGGGERSSAALAEEVRAVLAGSALLRLQYVAVVDGRSLEPVDPARVGSVLALAAFCGATRLIDNVTLE